MKIRLLIPECEGFNGYCSYESKDIVGRIELLNHLMNIGNGISLVVTSNNYFQFNTKPKADVKNFTKQILIPCLNKGIKNKIPVVFGFDFILRKGTTKKKAKVIKYGSKLNPYGGINAVVTFLNVSNNSFVYGNHIWECWEGKGKCDPSNFEKQNNNRVFKFRNKTFGLLSCGDIARYCHGEGKRLPSVDIYLDLSHSSLRGWSSQNRVPTTLIRTWRKAKQVFVTQQVKDVSTYLYERKYPYIFPKMTRHTVQGLTVGGERLGVYVDIDLK